MRRIGLTGARGRLAPILAEYFRSRGAEVFLFSRVPGPGILALEEVEKTRLSVLVHCAWSSVPYTAETDPAAHRSADLPLLEHLLKAGEIHRFVFLSTAAVYGDTGEQAAVETDPPAPLGAYARGKLEAEAMALRHSPDRVLVLRPSNLLGEPTFPERPQGILPRLIDAARHGSPVSIWGDGSATKDYLHCRDFCSALEALLNADALGVYNVVSERSLSVNQLIALVEAGIGCVVPKTFLPHFSWDVSFCRLSAAKLREATGWRPVVTVEEAIALCARSW